jgi:hypothetical protein
MTIESNGIYDVIRLPPHRRSISLVEIIFLERAGTEAKTRTF